jgi:hypothetical protein
MWLVNKSFGTAYAMYSCTKKCKAASQLRPSSTLSFSLAILCVAPKNRQRQRARKFFPKKRAHASFAFHVQHEQRQWVTHNTKTIQSVSNQESCLPRQMNIDISSKGSKKQQPGIRKNSHMCMGLRLTGDHHSNPNEAPLVDPQKGPRNR